MRRRPSPSITSLALLTPFVVLATIAACSSADGTNDAAPFTGTSPPSQRDPDASHEAASDGPGPGDAAPGDIHESDVAFDGTGGLLLRGSAVWSWGHDTPSAPHDPALRLALANAGIVSLRGTEGIFCGLLVDGGVGCVLDQHGFGASAPPQFAAVPGTEHVSQLAVGGQHACALDADGTILCWGRGGNGQLGSGYDNVDHVVRVGAPGDYVRVIAGARATCGIRAVGSVMCWGEALGEFPTEAWGGAHPDDVVMAGSEGDTLACARFGTSVRCNALGASPEAVVLTGVDAIGASEHQVCGHESTGGIACFGYHSVAGDPSSTIPHLISIKGLPADTKPLAIGGAGIVCGLSAGRLYCWGTNDFGQLGTTMAPPPPDQAVRIPL